MGSEMCIRDRTISDVNNNMTNLGFNSGIDLSESYPQFGQAMLVATTECHKKADIDAFAQALDEALS